MFVAAIVCLCAAVVTGALGVWSLTRPPSADFVARVLRGVAPTQLAAAAMLAAAAVVGLTAAPPTAAVLLTVCVVGAVGTVAAGCWQSAKGVALAQARQQASTAGDGCAGACGSCSLSCSD
ncbi:MAG: hypothetical protein SW019_05815 [Actinomycetota bacterium]|nr:hypothetical protein [Actinomycetota bacterium]